MDNQRSNIGMLSTLKSKSLRVLFGSQLFSDLANWIDFLALTTLIAYHWGLGADALAIFIIAYGLPWVFFGPIISVWTETLPKKSVMMICNIFRCLIAIGFIFAPNFFVLLIIVLLRGTLAATFDPVRQSTIRHITPQEWLPQVGALSQICSQVSKIAAPAIGGLTVSIIGSEGTFIVSSSCYFISLILIMFLPKFKMMDTEAKKENGTFIVNFKEGFRFIYNNKRLFIGIVLAASGVFLMFLYDGLYVLWSKDVGLGESGFGLLMSCIAFGSVLGSVAFGNWTFWKEHPLQFMCLSRMFSGIFILIIGVAGLGVIHISLFGWMFLLILMGINGTISSLPFGFLIQSETPTYLMARVSSVNNSIQTFSMLVAPALGALLASLIKVGGVFSLVGVAMIILSFTFNVIIKGSNHSFITSR